MPARDTGNPPVTELADLRVQERGMAEWGTQLRLLASLIDSMGQAMEEGDEILGSISGRGIADHLPALPKHIRDLFMEYLSDEAAAGYLADLRYRELVETGSADVRNLRV